MASKSASSVDTFLIIASRVAAVLFFGGVLRLLVLLLVVAGMDSVSSG